MDAVLRQLASAIDALERGERLLSPLAAGSAAVSETDAWASRVESVKITKVKEWTGKAQCRFGCVNSFPCQICRK